ncbi:hypothetical protein ACFQ4O_03615 [Methylopila musalis]|uniref:Serine/threonine protein kinase n=1 Tax=Methylopila musalis TaxID=1134781 RepID=A0ABW3Z477_9HYPH
MKRLAVLSMAAALALAPAAAFAQSPQSTPSTVDKPSEPGKASPGTTGAMDKAVGGAATSPQDVKRQNEGMAPAAEGGYKTHESPTPDVTKPSPGTVGGAPGANPPKPQ